MQTGRMDNRTLQDHIADSYSVLHAYFVTNAKRAGVSLEQAEDIVQTAFERLVRHANEIHFDNPSAVSAWLHTVVRNLVRDHYRRQKPTDSVESDDARLAEPEHRSPERAVISRHALLDALHKLTPPQQEALVWLAQGYSNGEIAASIGTTESAVESRAFAGRRKLAK